MPDLGYTLQFLARHLDWLAVLDILLVTLVIYGLLALVRGTQAVVLLRGIIVLAVATVILTSFLQLPAFSWLLRNALPALLIAVPVIFAPEIRRALERLGRASAGININTREAEMEQLVEAIAAAAVRLSERRHGALIVIERQVGLKDRADTGVHLDAAVTVELLVQIFRFPVCFIFLGLSIINRFMQCIYLVLKTSDRGLSGVYHLLPVCMCSTTYFMLLIVDYKNILGF